MKKIKHIVFTVLLLSCGLVYAKGVSISNTFGGDSSALEGNDFFTLGRTYNPEKNVYTLNDSSFQVSDRIQLEAEGDVVETKVRLDLFDAVLRSDDEESVIPNIKLKGYGLVKFNDYILIAAGNTFFSRFDVKGAELFAMDTLPKYGKILRNGAGVFGTIPLSPDSKMKIDVGAGIEYKSDFSDLSKLKIDAGAQFQIKKLMSVGFTAQSITAGEAGRYGIFASGNIFDFKLNAGFIYNNTESDLLVRDARYSVTFSGKYTNKDLKMQIALDVVSALVNNKGELGVPIFADVDASYMLNDKIKLAVNVMYKNLLYTKANYLYQVYPNVSYSSKSGKYSVSGGVKLYFEETTVKGLTHISLPVVCKVCFN